MDADPLKLTSWEPQINNGFLMFLCPNCQDHQIRVPLNHTRDHNNRSWNHNFNGNFDELTVTPSINVGCWHKNIKGGKFCD